MDEWVDGWMVSGLDEVAGCVGGPENPVCIVCLCEGVCVSSDCQ